MTRVPLRRQLLVLVLAGVLPLAVLAGVGVELMYTSRRDVERSRADELTRSLAVAVQAELEQSVAALQALTADPAFHGSERAPIDALLRRVLPTQGNWASLAVARPEGEVIVDTDLPPGLRPPPDFDAVSLERAALTAAPVIGDLTPSDSGYRFAIRVPVLRDGVVTHVLTATVLTAPIRDVLVDQQVPDDWVISVFDGHLRRVGRSRAHERFVGTAPARSLTELMRADPSSGHGVTTALEGTEHFTSYRRLADCDWTIAAGVSVAALNRAVLDSIALYTIALALSLIGGLGTAFALARRIDAEMTRLRDAAHALGRGEPLVAPQSTVLEIARVGVALADAAAERRAHETERDALLGRERSAREAAEVASREKDEFLAMLGHELRNPLSAVSTAAMVLERAGEGPAAERARGVIVRQVAHLARLTDDLLDASRALHGKIELRREPVDLARVVAHALATLERTGRVAGHTIVADLQPAVVHGDPIRLDQVASNLLVNAVKYTPPGAPSASTPGARARRACSSSRTTGSGCPSGWWRGSSICSSKASAPSTGRTAGSGSGSPSSAASSSCTAARSPPRATGSGAAASSASRSRPRTSRSPNAPPRPASRRRGPWWSSRTTTTPATRCAPCSSRWGTG